MNRPFLLAEPLRVMLVRAPLLLLLARPACGGDGASEIDETLEARPDRPELAPTRLDPSLLAPGDSIGGLRVESIDARPEVVDSFGWSGRLRFSGEVELRGTHRPHPEFPDVRAVCFYPDSASAAKLPRFPNDERVSWLCFTNQDEAERLLGLGTRETPIVVDDFDYVYEHTDSYNTARLVRVAPSSG